MPGAQEALQGLYANIVSLIIQPVAILKQTDKPTSPEYIFPDSHIIPQILWDVFHLMGHESTILHALAAYF